MSDYVVCYIIRHAGPFVFLGKDEEGSEITNAQLMQFIEQSEDLMMGWFFSDIRNALHFHRPLSVNVVEWLAANPHIRVLLSEHNYDHVQKWIEAGGSVNDMDGDTSVLMLAALHNRRNMVKLLLEHGAEVNKVNENGQTALALARQNNCLDGVQATLRKAGAIE